MPHINPLMKKRHYGREKLNGDKEKKVARKEVLRKRTMITKVTAILGDSMISKIEGFAVKSFAGAQGNTCLITLNLQLIRSSNE